MTHELICPECGAENPEDAKFCHACQASLTIEDSSKLIDPEQPEKDQFDLFMEDEDDLPGLLHALKQEGDSSTLDDSIQESEIPSAESENLFKPENTQDDEGVPEWLHRIRQRASKEQDSVGEVTQKISAAQDNVDGDKPTTQHENFETWIQRLKGPIAGEVDERLQSDQSKEDFDELQEIDQHDEPEWLKKIRKAEGKQEKSDEQAALGQDDSSLLNWLVTLEDDTEKSITEEGESIDGESEALDAKATQSKVDDSGITQEIPVDDGTSLDIVSPKLTVTPEEQAQAEQFTSMIFDEHAPRPVRKMVRRSSLGAVRFFLAILLIAIIILSFFIPIFPFGEPDLVPPYTTEFLKWAKDVPGGASFLLVFDYQPAYSSEINLVAQPILSELVEKEAQITVLSSSMSGPFLYQKLFEDISGFEMASIRDLGYFPISAYAAFGMGVNLSSNWQMVGLPKPFKALPSNGFDGVLILSDTYEGAKAWIEQLTILMPDKSMNLLVTAQAMPMLIPYFESGQVEGIVAGLRGGVILENELSGSDRIGSRWHAYQGGLLMLIAVIVIGAIYAGNQKREQKGA